MHRFIVYQYGKVGSTSIIEALNRRRGIEAYQSHFLGEAAFSDTLRRLMNPDVSDYFFDHSAGQLLENLRIYRHYLRREIGDDALTVITLAREPFDWFRSGISQDIQQHLISLKLMLDKRHIPYDNASEAVTAGLKLLFQRLLQAIQHFGSLDQMCNGKRYAELRKALTHSDQEDFQSFMFFVNIFLRPHLWFRTHFSPALGVSLSDMSTLACGAYKNTQDWGNIYLLKYEQLEESFPEVMIDLGYESKFKLPRRNVGRNKPFADELESIFKSGGAAQLKALCHSQDTRLLGYHT